MKSLRGIYAGSFDPITVGHIAIIKEAIKVVDRLIIAIGHNPAKKYIFDEGQRLDMVTQAIEDEGVFGTKTLVSVEPFAGKYLVDYAKERDINVIIKGLRDSFDFHDEVKQYRFNRKLNSDIQTIYFMADKDHTEISSSFVKALIGPEGWKRAVKDLVPPNVFNKLDYHYLRLRNRQ